MRLNYFNCITGTVIDPMHCLFLGIAKHMLTNVWPNKENFSKDSLVKVQEMINFSKTPAEIGTIPHKMASMCSNLNAKELKNWTLYFSVFCMFHNLTSEGFECWMYFVDACRYICQPVLSQNDVKCCHEQIMKFCRKFESLYGSELVTPNMHLSSHLVTCILDFGPVYGFWLFTFERMNGFLGSFKTNQRSVEIQIMHKFLASQNMHDVQCSIINSDLDTDFRKLMTDESHEDVCCKLTLDAYDNATEKLKQLSLRTENFVRGQLNRSLSLCGVELLGSMRPGYLEDYDIDCFNTSLNYCFNSVDTVGTFTTGAFNRYSSLSLYGEIFGSSESRTDRSSYILASWCALGGEINTAGNVFRPGRVLCYMQSYIKVANNIIPVIMARVQWYQSHPSKLLLNNNNATIWAYDLFEPDGPASFIPVQRIRSKVVSGIIKVQGERVRVVIPTTARVFW